jgi:hypothetical protein
MAPIRARRVPRSIARSGAGPLCLLVSAVMALVLLGLALAQPPDVTRPGFATARHYAAKAPHS